MKIETGDIWKFDGLKVIPTNVGWKKNGHNVMGRGLAFQASKIYPDLAPAYGQMCRTMTTRVNLAAYMDLILFPVKPLNVERPWLSWKQPASLELIKHCTKQLQKENWGESVALPLVGCGNGGLSIDDVMPILQETLDDRFTLVFWDKQV